MAILHIHDSIKDVMCMCKDDEEEKDMSIAANDMKSKLSDLKKRAEQRRANNNIRPSAKYFKELDENAKLLYRDQCRTIK